MEEWKEYSLSDIAKYSQGKQIPIQLQYEEKNDSLIRFIRIVDYTSNWNQPPRYVLQDSKYHIKSDDIVMIRYGTPGKVFRGHEGLIANNMFKISVNEDIIDKGYAFWYLSLEQVFKQLMSFQASTTMPAISFGMLRNIIMKVPSKTTQRKIAKILDTIDDKIEVNRRINDNLEQQAQALFKSWFVDFEFPNEEGEPYKSSGGKMVESGLGLIPEGWRTGSIYKYVKVIYGAPYKSTLFNENKEGNPLIRIRDLKTFTPQYYTPELLPNTEFVCTGDVVAGMDAEFVPCLWLGETGVLNQRCCKFIGNKDTISNYYVMFLLKPELEFVQSYKTGTTVSHLGKADIDRFTVIQPPMSLIARFSLIANGLLENKKKLAKEIIVLSSLRDTLLPKLMSGELNVDDVSIDLVC